MQMSKSELLYETESIALRDRVQGLEFILNTKCMTELVESIKIGPQDVRTKYIAVPIPIRHAELYPTRPPVLLPTIITGTLKMYKFKSLIAETVAIGVSRAI